MMSHKASVTDDSWATDDGAWRDPRQVVAMDAGAATVPTAQFEAVATGQFWDLLDELAVTLLVSREYEHLLMALSVTRGQPDASYLSLPHPSGIAVERVRGRVWVASTRNPNQVMEFHAIGAVLERRDHTCVPDERRPLIPIRTDFFPGCTYLHDLALIGGELHGNAVGSNTVIRFTDNGFERAWWPRSIERASGPDFSRNHLQLNSIAAGDSLATSCFTASVATPSARRPGHPDWPVDGRGVVLDGASREPMAGGLTRPHSARYHDGRIWVANSGYGELGMIEGSRFQPVLRMPGWTRGLSFCGSKAFVGTSRVIPRFREYAPGLDLGQSQCGVHIVDVATGRCLGSLTWPAGNQIFAVEWISRNVSAGLPYRIGADARSSDQTRLLFYAFDRTETVPEGKS